MSGQLTGTSAAKAFTDSRAFTAALEALRHPKPESPASRYSPSLERRETWGTQFHWKGSEENTRPSEVWTGHPPG
jgi:hypothetical protein